VSYDPTGKAPGRGAYLCGEAACLEAAGKRGRLQRALKAADGDGVAGALDALRAALAGGGGNAGRPPVAASTGATRIEQQGSTSVGASHVSELEEVRTG
jgi:hypothetical protein